MGYQVLARKWRPKSFPELVGQEHVKNTLINALEMGRLHHAYLFTGTRGVGKTTIARIFAKSLNCEQGITANPCGQCNVCLSIEKGQFVDLIEIDAASRTKVEDTREILDNVQYAPTQGRFKVYLIDEVHMLSRHSFNALLKTLEEPPPHVKFLLATTDPQKLPITILSRCLQFNLRALLRNEIIEHLKYILGEETITFDEESLRLLAKSADGSLRDALSLTDQAIAQSKGGLTATLVRQMLGTIDQQWSVKLLAHIVNQNPDKALDTVEEIAQFMPDYRNLIDQLLSLFHLAAMSQLVPSVAKIDENLQAFVTRLAQKLSPQDVQLYYQILLNGKKDLELAPDPRMGFEMVLLRVLAFQPLNTVERPAVGDIVKVAAPKQAVEALPVPDPKPESAPAPAPVFAIPAKKNTEIRPTELKQPTPAVEQSLETLNEQQNTLLFSAQQQGFKPVEAPKVEPQPARQAPPEPKQAPQLEPQPMTRLEPQQTPQIEPAPVPMQTAPVSSQNEPPPMEDISFSNDDEPDYGYMEFDQGTSMGMEMDMAANPPGMMQSARPSLPSIEPVAKPTDENYEDPVAAILANRNLPIDNMFGSGEQEAKTEPLPNGLLPNKELQSEKKPIARDIKPVEKPRAAALFEHKPQSEPPLFEQSQTEPVELAPVEVEAAQTPEPAPLEVQSQAVEPQAAEAHEPEPTEVAVASQSGLPRWAADIDQWASLIEQMGLGGLVRLLAVKSMWHKEDKVVTLTVSRTEQHLDSQGLRDQLTKSLIRVLNEVIELELEFTEEEYQTPFNIQRKIEVDRLANAKQLIYQDPLVIALQQQFAANVDDSSIAAVG
ncbi:MAG: DNA polymerase III subunit gamma/tau [Algicola sp.]|nr:DNA polymerase III subunit gamma/tau [Algicola sp.]